MQEYCRRLAGTDSADTALVASCSNNKSKSSKPFRPLGKRCGYCHTFGHTKDECRKKKKHEEQDAESSDSSRGQSKERKKAPCSSHESESDSDGEKAKLASFFA